ncbi:MAG: outer membrane protein [Afipia sp.]
MKFEWRTGLALILFPLASSAYAADLDRSYVKAPPAIDPPVYWSGFYVGGTVGAAWSTNKVRLNAVDNGLPAQFQEDGPNVSAFGSDNFSRTNVIFGGKAGYNQQVSGNWVLGIEADISSLRFSQSTSKTGNPFVTFPGGSATFNTSVSTDWVATLRPRIGYAFGRGLFYATAGAAFGNERFANTYADFANHGFGFGSASSAASAIKAGWAAGAGIDYALSNNWIVSIEYLHVDLGKVRASGAISDTGGTVDSSLNFSSKLESDIVRAGIAYKFGGPVVARY